MLLNKKRVIFSFNEDNTLLIQTNIEEFMGSVKITYSEDLEGNKTIVPSSFHKLNFQKISTKSESNPMENSFLRKAQKLFVDLKEPFLPEVKELNVPLTPPEQNTSYFLTLQIFMPFIRYGLIAQWGHEKDSNALTALSVATKEEEMAEILLVSSGEDKGATATVLQSAAGLSPKAANKLVVLDPSRVIKKDIPKDEAKAIQQELEAVGATTELRPIPTKGSLNTFNSLLPSLNVIPFGEWSVSNFGLILYPKQ